MEMPHLLQTEKCHDGGTGSWEAASEGRETWEIHFRREVVRNHQAEVKGLRENGQDVEDGQDPGDVGSHGPHLWDGLNMGGGVAAGQMGLGTSLKRPQESLVSSWERMGKPRATGGPGRW